MSHVPKTNDKNNYIGIEIEFFSKYSNNYIHYIFNKNKLLKTFCKLGFDNSVHDPYNTYEEGGQELKILTKIKDLQKNLLVVKNFLKLVDAKVNSSCGLHVHLDTRNIDGELVLKRLVKHLDHIEGSVPKQRLDNSYSCSIKDDVQPMLKVMKYYKRGISNTSTVFEPRRGHYTKCNVPDYFVSRYRSINIESMLKYKTIEVRCHEGTVNCAEIYNWCEYLCDIAYNRKNKRSVNYINKRVKTKGKYEAKRIA